MKKKTKISTMTLLLTLTISAILVVLPVVSAHDPPLTLSTYTYISVQPNPIGVNQIAYVNMWIDKVPPTATGAYGIRWHNFTVTVTKPNGEIEVLGPYDSDPAGGAWDTYKPDQTGTYAFQASFPGQVAKEENPYPYVSLYPLGDEYINDTYTGSTSKIVYLTVQQDAIETNYPSNPFPTEYWERPIHSMNRNWYSLGGNWLGLKPTYFGYSGMYDATGNFNPYTTAPNTAHIMWTEQVAFGGQIGGEFGESETAVYASGTAYEAKFNPVIIQGILYYTEYPGASTNPGNLTAVDLRTGETVWTKRMTDDQHTLKCGMVYNFKTGNQYGAYAYLFTANPQATVYGMGFVITPEAPKWSMYDAKTGNWILDIANASSASQLFTELGFVSGPNGEILSYTVANGMLTLWNSSRCIEVGAQANNIFTVGPASDFWRPPQGATIDWNGGNEWSVQIATEISGVPINPALAPISICDDVILMTASDTSTPGWFQTGWRVDAGYNATTGELLWGPINRTLTPWTGKGKNILCREGVYAVYDKNFMIWDGFNITTGEKLWTTEPKNNTWGYYDVYGSGVIGYGNLYTWGLGGEVYCYDVHTGEEKWYWTAGSAGIDSPYGVWPLGTFFDSYILADGKLYLRAGHDYTPPLFKGAKLYCLDAYEGEEVWSSLSFNILSSPAVADGYMVWFNGYDNQIYCYGKGPTKTTVTASPKVTVQESSIIIEGTVTDESYGTKTSLLTSRFPNGVPAVSDEDQSAWMEYLYQQQPKPEDVTGVEVFIKIQDPNGDYYSAIVTSDENGMFSHMWSPSVIGEYHVTAMFEGSESYYASQAITTFGVDEAAAAASVPSAEEIADTTVGKFPAIPEIPAYLTIDLIILIIAAVGVIIGLIAYMALRKQK
jgi:outer membrane protein assembly factor BamB